MEQSYDLDYLRVSYFEELYSLGPRKKSWKQARKSLDPPLHPINLIMRKSSE